MKKFQEVLLLVGLMVHCGNGMVISHQPDLTGAVCQAEPVMTEASSDYLQADELQCSIENLVRQIRELDNAIYIACHALLLMPLAQQDQERINCLAMVRQRDEMRLQCMALQFELDELEDRAVETID